MSAQPENAFAARLAVEQPIRLVGLLESPAVGEESVDADLAIGDEGRTFGLADR